MKTTTTTNAATAARLAKMRANLSAIKAKADAILQKGDSMTAEERHDLLTLVNVAFHEGSSKIEGLYSIDSSVTCDFCECMRDAAKKNPLMICGGCYAAKDAWKEAAWRRHKLNARILSEVLFTVEELATLAIGDKCRFNEDGDTVNDIMARNYLRIAASHPQTRFGYWYKNAPAVETGLHAEGYHTRETLPKNVRFIHSSLLIGFPVAALWFDDATFTVYPDEETTLTAVAEGARECNGKRCRSCGFTCYLMNRQPSAVNIAEVLRASKATVKATRAAYDAMKARKDARTVNASAWIRRLA